MCKITTQDILPKHGCVDKYGQCNGPTTPLSEEIQGDFLISYYNHRSELAAG